MTKFLEVPGYRYVWDDSGRIVTLDGSTTLHEWEWTDDGALTELRFTTTNDASVTRWSEGCAPSTWWAPEVPDPGPWPSEPQVPEPYGPRTPW